MTKTQVPSVRQNFRWFVYILQSEVTGRLYTGITNNLEARLVKHNAGKGAKATRPGRPWKIVYTETTVTKGFALQREYGIKSFTRKQKLELIQASKRSAV